MITKQDTVGYFKYSLSASRILSGPPLKGLLAGHRNVPIIGLLDSRQTLRSYCASSFNLLDKNDMFNLNDREGWSQSILT